MKLKYTSLYVEDVAATFELYEKAFGLKTSMLHESGDQSDGGTFAGATT